MSKKAEIGAILLMPPDQRFGNFHPAPGQRVFAIGIKSWGARHEDVKLIIQNGLTKLSADNSFISNGRWDGPEDEPCNEQYYCATDGNPDTILNLLIRLNDAGALPRDVYRQALKELIPSDKIPWGIFVELDEPRHPAFGYREGI